ncbi:hypothetical protein D0869_14660 [Hortaea werneckii]|uniref:Adenylyltransferase and sulfurtransferase uba4 n=1 Tax=Hortaea werneckii TaxID=91943 RepID=A0A3M6W1K6_HORWE|nr:Molybdopterin-synthase sulfurtransferase [Hortaea werneckii]KAI7576380.1 Molybdopterin-synthase sulfurtransferase [Hortaea werneckii]RMX72399.1 hypothetical protein D0869_14660 [Hortaea werneckii]RMX93827.1 hypothetical protein D0868_12628 [Hortaea werneckii]
MQALQDADERVRILKTQVQEHEDQLRHLKVQLQHAETQAQATRDLHGAYQGGMPAEWIDETLSALHQDIGSDVAQRLRQEGGVEGAPTAHAGTNRTRWPLNPSEYKRYGRQLIMPEVGLHGQLRLKNARVLIVGVGGLGCPAAAYLAGAGVGTIGLMDGDTVEESNLHRQVAHTTSRVGMNKAESAREYLKSLNNTIQINVYMSHLSPEYALDIFRNFDLVLDCTDHPTSRYLISDACVLAGKPLVSASALKTEGQLIVLNNPPAPPGDAAGGPCYRCVFPAPPPPESVLSCGEGGILGPVVGTMGVLQALEAVKVLTAKSSASKDEPVRPTLLIFSAYSHPQFRSVRMRGRRADCACCSSQASITPQSLTSGSLDYVAFCGVSAPVDLLGVNNTVSATAFSHLPRDGINTLIDVRDETQYAICALRGSINIPWPGSAAAFLENVDQRGLLPSDGRQLFTVCRFGNDSQLAARALLGKAVNVKNITGGFEAWRREVDPTWPDY